MSTALVPVEAHPVAVPAQADDDGHMLRLWLPRSSSPNTRRNYEREARRFLAHVGRPLGAVRMGDLQDYIASRLGSSATVEFAAAALKSLFAFAQEAGYLRFNVGAAVKVPPIKNTLAERIMPEGDALLMIRQEPAFRKRVLLTGPLRRRLAHLGSVWAALAGSRTARRGGAGNRLRQGRQDAHDPAVGRDVEGAAIAP
ncbi:site-specific integrase [Methylorubrum aminovorans]